MSFSMFLICTLVKFSLYLHVFTTNDASLTFKISNKLKKLVLKYQCLKLCQHMLCYVLLCFSSSCEPYVASFSGLSNFVCSFGILLRLFNIVPLIILVSWKMKFVCVCVCVLSQDVKHKIYQWQIYIQIISVIINRIDGIRILIQILA